jgi:hypothetical protein
MTRFWRRDSSRIVCGIQYPVRDGPVDRDDWSRHGHVGSNDEYFRIQLLQEQVRNSEFARFVNPNANCPICNEPVFYYQNEFGSRVFFDELGPPWPKHPCTDSKRSLLHAKEFTFVEPQARSVGDISQIQHWLEGGSFKLDQLSTLAHGRKAWTKAKIVKRFRNKGKFYLVLKLLKAGISKKLFIKCSSLPKRIKEGSVIAIKNDRISFLNPKTLEPKDIAIERIKSAQKFLEQIIGDVT